MDSKNVRVIPFLLTGCRLLTFLLILLALAVPLTTLSGCEPNSSGTGSGGGPLRK